MCETRRSAASDGVEDDLGLVSGRAEVLEAGLVDEFHRLDAG
jgi:hypothetical protein